MPVVLNPYLTFPGTAREAMTFYQSVFGGDLNVSTFGEFGAEGDDADGVMHAQLQAPSGMVLMASDTAPGTGDGYTPGTHMSVSISGDDEAIRGYWQGLSEGATVTMPMEKQMWGDEFGMLTDRFGIPWMVNIGTGAADAPADADAGSAQG
jgi:PhnB protein